MITLTDIIIIPELFENILIFLRPIEQLALKYVCKSTSTIFIDWPKLVKKFLDKRVYSPDDFINLIQKSNSIISGSAILQILYDEKWKDSDIDVYTLTEGDMPPSRNNPKNEYPDLLFPDSLCGQGYSAMSQADDISDQIVHVKGYPAKLFIKKYGVLPFHSMKYKHENHDLVINWLRITKYWEIKLKSLHSYIDYYFDLSCCKVSFDGKNLRVKDLERLFKRKSTVDLNFAKYRKYIGLIYKESFFEKVPNPESVSKQRITERIKKYTERGFEIINT